MIIRSCLQLGVFHPVFCEDFLCHGQINDSIWFAAVMDGCTMGKESHFASTLVAKILKKTIKNYGYQSFYLSNQNSQIVDPSFHGRAITEQFRKDFRKMASDLYLELDEQLTTLLFAVIEVKTNKAWVLSSGDGVVSIEEKTHIIEQGNKPDYFAYHWEKDFNNWFSNHCSCFHFKNISSLYLSTDGILAFEPLKNIENRPEIDSLSFLLNHSKPNDSQTLESKIRVLKNQFGLIATDDIAMIHMHW